MIDPRNKMADEWYTNLTIVVAEYVRGAMSRAIHVTADDKASMALQVIATEAARDVLGVIQRQLKADSAVWNEIGANVAVCGTVMEKMASVLEAAALTGGSDDGGVIQVGERDGVPADENPSGDSEASA